MKLILSIWLLLITFTFFGQGGNSFLRVKPIGTDHRLYYAPVYRIEAHHTMEGVGNLRHPTDSINKDKIIMSALLDQKEWEDSLTARSREPGNLLTLLVDTSMSDYKEVILLPTYRLNGTYSSYPRSLRVNRNGRLYQTPLTKDTTVLVVAQPVFIANLSEEKRYLVGNSGHLLITQQAKDKAGNWQDIEIEVPGGCGMVKYICELETNDFVLTTVYRFQGSFKTQLRIKLETANHTFYSKPFAGFIDYEQVHNPKIKTIKSVLYERL
jgi:hypothetical protein